jgi:hypothetical protein
MGPDFLIIGAPRSGTTALYEALARHPRVFMTRLKEPLFFLRDQRSHRLQSPLPVPAEQLIETWDQYLELFRAGAESLVRGEASTLYLYDEHAARRIAARLSDVRLIAILRDPVSRAYSHYSLHRLRGTEPEPTFEAALAEEPVRLRERWSPFWLYRAVGLYADQVARYQSLFRPEQLLFLLQEDLEQRPAATYDRVLRFLNLPLESPMALTAGVNASARPRNSMLSWAIRPKNPLVQAARRVMPRSARRRLRQMLTAPVPQLNPATARELRAFYREDIERTGALIGRDLSHWLQPPTEAARAR